MTTYSHCEKIDMILVIGECNENCLLASRVYAQKYPNRRHPNRRSLENLLQVFRRTGSVCCQKPERQRPITGNEENHFVVIESLIENPHTSQRKISETTGISKRSVGRILKKNNFFPYHIQLHQALLEVDYDRRLVFCLWVLEKFSENENFFDFVLFSDESSFHNNGLVNRHNFHYYSDENPRFFRTLDRQHRWCVNVWGGIIGTQVVGPFFFDGHLNGAMFLRFLRDNLPVLLENIPLNIRKGMWLQLDGAPAHFEVNVRNELDRQYPNRWIGRGGPHNWPARSPDLTSPDFFLWGYIKNIVYDTPPTTPDDMRERIRNAFRSITPYILRRVNQSFQDRIRLCIETDGHHFEHLLKH